MGNENVILLFVYGTLLTTEPRHGLVRPWVISAEPAETSGRLYALPEGFPALLPEEDGSVRGELLALRPGPWLAELDRYEDFDPADPRSLYVRAERPVKPAHGGRAPAWCYLWNPARRAELLARGTEIAGGDWRRR